MRVGAGYAQQSHRALPGLLLLTLSNSTVLVALVGVLGAWVKRGKNCTVRISPAVTRLISQGASAATDADADVIWGRVETDVMADAPIYPISAPNQSPYHASYVHDAVYLPVLGQFDPTNVWLSSP